MSARRVLLACDLDSQVYGALPLAHAFAARGWKVSFAIQSARALPRQILDRLSSEFDVVERPLAVLAADDLTFDHQAVGVFGTGSRLALFRHLIEFSAQVKARPRPALFCGFNGLVFEKFEEGLAWRLGYDVIGLNGPRDRDAFEDFVHATAFERQPAVVVGLKRRIDVASPPAAARTGEARKLFVFAEQVVVPRELEDRRRLVGVLADLARKSPNWDVVLKGRVRPDERTFHLQPTHISALVKNVRPRPENFSVSYEPLDGLLARADLFATISSTAAFDAFDSGVPCLISADFGLRNADGSHVFFASGLLTRLGDLRSLDDAPVRRPDDRWLERVGYADDFSPAALVERLEAFDPSQPLPAAFAPYNAALASALGDRAAAQPFIDLWDEIRTAVHAAGQDDGPDAAARRRAALDELAARLGQAMRPGVLVRGPIVWLARRIRMYWLYKRIRARIGFPLD